MQSILNLKDKLPSSNRHKNIVLLYSRSHDHLPLTKISLENGNILNLCKSVCSDPFDDAYEPTLLDSFPVCGAPEVAMVSNYIIFIIVLLSSWNSFQRRL